MNSTASTYCLKEHGGEPTGVKDMYLDGTGAYGDSIYKIGMGT